jgi:hypothetical protein
MISFSDGLRHLYQQGLSEITTEVSQGVNKWLSEGKDYYPFQDLLQNDFTLTTFDLNLFLQALAFDINRLSCASIESLNDIQQNSITPKFLGWIITKYYYSAFFSASSILRITGNSLLNMENNSLNKIRELTRTRGFLVRNISSGLYCLSINPANNTFRFFKDSQYDDSHKGLWLKFLHFLVNNKNCAFSHILQSDAQLIEDKIDELILAITNSNNSNGNWLSTVRNSVNYSQNFGIWYPYKGFSNELIDIINYQNLCKINPLKIDLTRFRGKDLLYFVRTCQLINAINFDLQKDLVKRNSLNKSFLLHGVFAYQKKYLKKNVLIEVN